MSKHTIYGSGGFGPACAKTTDYNADILFEYTLGMTISLDTDSDLANGKTFQNNEFLYDELKMVTTLKMQTKGEHIYAQFVKLNIERTKEGQASQPKRNGINLSS